MAIRAKVNDYVLVLSTHPSHINIKGTVCRVNEAEIFVWVDGSHIGLEEEEYIIVNFKKYCDVLHRNNI